MKLRIVYYDKAGEVKYKFLNTDNYTIQEHEKQAKEFVAKEGGKFIAVQVMA